MLNIFEIFYIQSPINAVKSEAESDSGVEEFEYIVNLVDIIHILNEAVNKSNYEELDRIINNIEGYEDQSITLDDESLRNLCSQQFNLHLQNRSDHQYIYSNILLNYKRNMENDNYTYSVKELILLAIVANDQLTERYSSVLFSQDNLSLLLLLIGSEKYISIFIEKFFELYQILKEQTITTCNWNISFFAIIALRKEQKLLNRVDCILKDLIEALQKTGSHPLYGILESASLIENEWFIKAVLNSIERHINELDKSELLKNSFATLLNTAISQEHVLIVEHLCKKCTADKDLAIYEIYKKALSDSEVIEQVNTQIIKNVHSAGKNRKEFML